MIFEQLRDPELGCLSYVLGDEGEGRAIVVDPLERLGIETYLEEAANRGLAVTEVIDTHIHADHVSIGRALAEAAGARYLLSERAEVTYPFEPLKEGDVLTLGPLKLEVLFTPGHTPEAISLLVTDTTRGPEPWFVLTGDSLFIGDVARPDLILAEQSERPEARARVLYRSLVDRLLRLPDTVEVYPAHYGASTCGGQHMSGKTVSTVGFERRYNVALQQGSEDAFVAFVLSTLKPLPDRYEEIKRTNLGQVTGHV
jgi:hydroxyacylglutathione hydrolase